MLVPLSLTSIPYFLCISQWILVPNQSCHLLYSFCDNVLHSLNIWFTFSSPHTFYTYCFIGSYKSLLLCKWFFKHAFRSHLYQSSLALSIVCLINCPFNCFCVHFVFLSFFFFFLYSCGVPLSSLSSVLRAAINSLFLLFLT